MFETIAAYFGGQTVGYSHRGEGRHPIPIRVALAKSGRVVDERALATPVPANLLPGDRSVVELGDVVTVGEEQASYPIFRHNMRAAEMVTAELAGAFEAPVYGMIAVEKALDVVGKLNIDFEKLNYSDKLYAREMLQKAMARLEPNVED